MPGEYEVSNSDVAPTHSGLHRNVRRYGLAVQTAIDRMAISSYASTAAHSPPLGDVGRARGSASTAMAALSPPYSRSHRRYQSTARPTRFPVAVAQHQVLGSHGLISQARPQGRGTTSNNPPNKETHPLG